MAVDKRATRLGVLAVVGAILFGTVGVRLWFLQTVEAEALQVEVEETKRRTVPLLPERGRIFDSDGRILADNERVLTVAVDWEVLRRPSTRSEIFTRLSGWVGVPVEEMEARYDDPATFSPFLPMPVAEDVDERPPLKQVRLNRCPFVAPISVLRPEDARRLDIDPTLVEARRDTLLATPGLHAKIARVYSRDEGDSGTASTPDVEERLYDGFTPDPDRNACEKLQRELRAKAPWPNVRFADARLTELATRLKARIRPADLSTAERADWNRFVAARLTSEHPRRLTVAAYRREVAERLDAVMDADERKILQALEAYGAELEARAVP